MLQAAFSGYMCSWLHLAWWPHMKVRCAMGLFVSISPCEICVASSLPFWYSISGGAVRKVAGAFLLVLCDTRGELCLIATYIGNPGMFQTWMSSLACTHSKARWSSFPFSFSFYIGLPYHHIYQKTPRTSRYGPLSETQIHKFSWLYRSLILFPSVDIARFQRVRYATDAPIWQKKSWSFTSQKFMKLSYLTLSLDELPSSGWGNIARLFLPNLPIEQVEPSKPISPSRFTSRSPPLLKSI